MRGLLVAQVGETIAADEVGDALVAFEVDLEAVDRRVARVIVRSGIDRDLGGLLKQGFGGDEKGSGANGSMLAGTRVSSQWSRSVTARLSPAASMVASTWLMIGKVSRSKRIRVRSFRAAVMVGTGMDEPVGFDPFGGLDDEARDQSLNADRGGVVRGLDDETLVVVVARILPLG